MARCIGSVDYRGNCFHGSGRLNPTGIAPVPTHPIL